MTRKIEPEPDPAKGMRLLRKRFARQLRRNCCRCPPDAVERQNKEDRDVFDSHAG